VAELSISVLLEASLVNGSRQEPLSELKISGATSNDPFDETGSASFRYLL
jgi:hypothetical protein